MNVERVMTKDVVACRPEETLSAAADAMWRRDCGALPVADEQGRVIGIITDRDICLAGRSRTLKLGEMYVHETMTSDVRTCRAGDDVKDAEREMRAARVRRLPVVDEGGRLKGILSLSDIAREAVRERGEAGPEVSALELAVTLAKITEPRTSATRA